MYQTSLISELRRSIKDQHPVFQCMTVGVTDSDVTTAILELTQGHLILTVSGGTTVRAFDLDLSSLLVVTVGKLAANLARMAGITAILDNDANPDHPSIDIEEFGPMDVRVQGVQLRHRVFSDRELHGLLEAAVLRHNPSMSVQTVPAGERSLVLQLAQAGVVLQRAQDATKRRGTSETVADLLALHRVLEDQYTRDARRLQRVIQSPKEPHGHRVGQGDILLGTLYRQSLRTGTMAPASAALPPPPVVLCEPDDRDEADVDVRVRWERPNSSDSYSVELWTDSRPEVVRGLGYPQVGSSFSEFTSTEDETSKLRKTTSRMVGRWNGPTFSATTRGAWLEAIGPLQHAFVVQELEPESDYYFRVFLSNVNGEFSESNVVRFRTKPLRCRFRTTSPLSATSGAAAAVITANFDTAWGAYTVNHSMTLGGKALTVTTISGTQVTFPVPTFQTKGLKELVVYSPSGLHYVLPDPFEVL